MKIIAVRDSAIEAFGTPFFTQTVGQAIRSFIDEINRPESNMGQHPEDYDLYEIGEYDTNQAQITVPAQPRLIAVGKDVRNTA